MPKLQLSFHGTFALKKEDLLKILQACSEEKGLEDTKERLMERTGLGNQKVTPMKSWAVRAGLVSKNYLSAVLPAAILTCSTTRYLEGENGSILLTYNHSILIMK